MAGTSSILTGANTIVTTFGAESHAAILTGGSTLDMTNGELTASGADANAVQIVGDAGATNTVRLDSMKLAATQGVSIDVDTSDAKISLKNSQAIVNNGTWLSASNGTSIDIDLDGSTVRGAARTDASSTSTVQLAAKSLWTMTGDSNLTSLANGGLIVFDATNPYKTLTTGDLLMTGGTFVLNTQLAAEAAPTDMVVVTGDTSGTGKLKINNVDGSGAQTLADGIKVVQVKGISNGAFTLLGDYVHDGAQAVVGGAYAYKLYKNGVTDPADGDWYLRSEMKDKPIDPVDPVDPVKPPKPPLYQAGAPVYEAYPQVLLGLNGLPSLQQRVGNRYWNNADNRIVAEGADIIGSPYAAPEEAGSVIKGNGVWGRVEGARNRIDPRGSTTNMGYDYNSYRLQAGLDGMFLDNQAGTLIGGITIHYVRGTASTWSVYDADNGGGKISTDGYGLGGTLTWYGENGFYLDAQGQVTWYDSDLSFDGGNQGLVTGNGGIGYALSLEGGKRIAFAPNWSLTPQAQIIYSSVDFDSFHDSFDARVSLDRGDSLQGRLGLTLDHQTSWYNAEGMIDRTHVYGIANLYYEFLEGTEVGVSGTNFTSRDERLWGGIGIGGSFNWNNDKYSIYGEGSINTSLTSFADSYDYKATVGFKTKW